MDEALRGERRRRNRLYLIGTAVAMAGIIMGTAPLFADHTPLYVSKDCAGIGAVILAVGRFASDHFLRRWFP